MKQEIKDPSGKIRGYTYFFDDKIIVDYQGKPRLEIIDKKIIQEVKSQKIEKDTLLLLYNEYTMSIAEIASVFQRCHSNIGKLLRSYPEYSSNHKGRRNRAYGHKVSKEQSEKMSKSLKGRKAPFYERTPQIKEKISSSLKQYFSTHQQDPQPHISNWKQGKYNEVDFKRGIGGYFTSLKNKHTFFFRSLLELYFLLKIEENDEVKKYSYEPFKIAMDNGRSYTPDFLLNDKAVIELKSKKFMEKVEGVKEQVLYKKEQAEKYCKTHQLNYLIIYDEDIGFNSRKMKRYLFENKEVVEKYKITFLHPERIVIK